MRLLFASFSPLINSPDAGICPVSNKVGIVAVERAYFTVLFWHPFFRGNSSYDMIHSFLRRHGKSVPRNSFWSYIATKPIATAFVDHLSDKLRSLFKLLFHFNSYFHKTLHKISETNIA